MRWASFITLVIGNLCTIFTYMYLHKLFPWKTNNVLTFAKMSTSPGNADWKSAKSIYDFSAVDIHGNEVSLEKYRGHVALIVNLASKCGLTASNYQQLNALHEKYAETKGLRILGFPCNQFGGQEPGTEAQICEFVKQKNVQFDLFSKIDVNGADTHPLWSYLKHTQGGTLGDFIKWNFSKFLIDKNGQPVKRYAPTDEPNTIEPDLLKYFD